MKRDKIGIIGAGHVGTHVASALALSGLCGEIVLLDCDEKKAAAAAMDLADPAVFLPRPTVIRAGGYADLADAGLVVLAAGAAILEADRLLELSASAGIVADVAPRLTGCGFAGAVVSITNPCDLVAQLLAQRTGLTVVGSGTALDTARLRRHIAAAAQVAPAAVEAWVLGEHGDSQVAALSAARIGGRPAAERCSEAALAEAARATVSAGWDIAEVRGCTEFGIGSAAADLCAAMLRDEHRVLACSAMLAGEYGEQGVFAGLPRVVGAAGALLSLPPQLNAAEQECFARSCALLRENAARLGLAV